MSRASRQREVPGERLTASSMTPLGWGGGLAGGKNKYTLRLHLSAQ